MNRKDQMDLRRFKDSAVKLPVKLKDLKIVSNSWTEEREKYTDRNQAGIVLYNKLTNNDHKNVDYVNVNMNRITYKFTYDGKKYFYTTLLDMEKEKLRTWIVFHEETHLYLNPETGEIYLDLEFMNN
ncbi:hypothetical protein [Bergeyella sp. RCAD1439]|uniref:hypothetical protein n=1 Tax=Bergeyella anatis TaxID=3113737 RepID=UPI002E16D51A|nr:hypothetical protein [Bergeyella sp. RCAD1439]